MIGVYKIVNTVDGTAYIGSSINLDARISVHHSELRRGDHYNAPLQQAWDNEGEDAFEFHVLQIITEESLEDINLEDIEQSYLDEYSANGHCYNLKKRVCRPTRRKAMNPASGSNIGLELKVSRALAELSQKEVTAAVGITVPYLSMIENDAASPSPRLLRDLKEAVRWTPAVSALVRGQATINKEKESNDESQ